MLDARFLKRILIGLVLAILAVMPLLIAMWSHVAKLIEAYEPQMKLVGYIIGPIFALLGFLWTRINKHELRRQPRS